MNPKVPGLHSSLPHSSSPLCLVIRGCGESLARRSTLSSPPPSVCLLQPGALSSDEVWPAPNCLDHIELWANALCEGAPQRNNFK